MDGGHPVETTMFAGYATKHSYAIIGSDEASSIVWQYDGDLLLV